MKKILLTTILGLSIAISSFAQSYSGGDGSENNPYLISSNADMETLANAVNGGKKYSGTYFLLTQNLSGITTMIGPNLSYSFSGIFDGGNHILDVNISDYTAGIFGYISYATIKNLGVSGTISSSYSGGICGYASSSTISNCYSTGAISSSAAYSGGICGYISYGKIIDCLALNNVITTSYEGTAGRIAGYFYSNDAIENCYALSSILVNDATTSSQLPTSKDGKDVSLDFGTQIALLDVNNFCSNNSTTIRLNTTNTIRWERSTNNGQTWENIACTGNFYTEENPLPGTYIYRALNGSSIYSDQVTVHYSNAIPATINTSPNTTVTRIAGESITFTLDVQDDGYNYQWYKGGAAINGAVSNTYTIDSILVANTGVYYCVVSNSCNTFASSTSILPVNKAPQLIPFETVSSKTYGDAAFYLPQYTDKGLPVTYVSDNEGIVKITGNKVDITGAGSASITASQAGDTNYNQAGNVTQSVYVAKSAQQITFGSLPVKTFGDSFFELTASSNSGSPVTYQSSNTSVATVSGNTVRIVGAGETYITASSAENSNYFAATPQQQLLTVNKGTQTVSLEIIPNKTYGDEAFVLAGTSTSGLPVTYKSSDPAKLLISGNTATIMEAGTFTVTATQEGSTNYLSNSTTRTFTVNKAPLTIIAENKERFYGDDNPALTYAFNGFKNGDNRSNILVLPTISCNADKESAAGGNYNIVVSNASDNNYSFLYQNGKLMVNKAPLTVKSNNETRTYGDENPSFTFTYSGFKNGEGVGVFTEMPVAATTARRTSNVGVYDINISSGSAANYELSLQPGKLTVEKAILTITAENAQRGKGETNPFFALSFHGFKNDEDASVLNELPTIVCAADEQSPIGLYDIVLSGGADNNYTYSLVNGKLEITQLSGIEDSSVSNLSIYPNPVKQYLFIDADSPVEKVEIYSQSGVCVLIEDNFMEKLDVSHLADGFYFIRIYVDGISVTKKIIKK